jgi:hypothetical protein
VPSIANTLRSYLKKQGSPLADHVPDLIRSGRRYQVDPRLIVAIANAETSLGKAGSGPAVYNAWGIGPGRAYRSWSQGIDAMAKLLRTGYLDEGRTSFTSLYPKYVWGKADKQGDPNADWVRNASNTYAALGGNPNNVTRGWRNASAPAATRVSYGPPVEQPTGVLRARPTFDVMDPQFPLDALNRVAQGGSAVASFRSMIRAMDWAKQIAGPFAQDPKNVRPKADARGHPTDTSSQTIDPGGGWGGSYAPATQLAKVGERFGLVPTSEKRDTKMTASGNVSDHWVGSKSSYAYDLGGSVAQMDQAARAIAQRLGISYDGKGPLVATKIANGLRYQILYRTNVGGNHFDHIHIGVRRI